MTTMKALIVEDDHALHDLYGHVLRRAGYEVFHALDGGEAIEMLESGVQPDLIVLDIRMPHVDGAEVVAYLQTYAHVDYTHVLVASASSSYRDYVSMLPSASFMLKPILPAQLVEVATKLLKTDSA